MPLTEPATKAIPRCRDKRGGRTNGLKPGTASRDRGSANKHSRSERQGVAKFLEGFPVYSTRVWRSKAFERRDLARFRGRHYRSNLEGSRSPLHSASARRAASGNWQQ